MSYQSEFFVSSANVATIPSRTLLNLRAGVSNGKFDDYITINGNVAPIATIYMDAYEGGRVSEKLIEEGAMVKKGDSILR